MKTKLGLGTVQFGLNYGISNNEGKTGQQEVRSILEYALSQQITMLDTASAYGNSEAVLGRELKYLSGFDVVTKVPPVKSEAVNSAELNQIEAGFTESLEKLGRQSIYGLLLHKADDLLLADGEQLYSKLQQFKSEGRVKKIGVSVYEKEILDQLLQTFDIDMIQVPLNILDQRLLSDNYLSAIHSSNIEVHVRSVFLQGLLLMQPDQLTAQFNPLKNHLKEYLNFLYEKQITPLAAALAFVSNLKEVDKVICGVNHLAQLKEIVNASRTNVETDEFYRFAFHDENILNPAKWNVGKN